LETCPRWDLATPDSLAPYLVSLVKGIVQTSRARKRARRILFPCLHRFSHFLGASFGLELFDPVKDSVFAGEAVSEIPAAEELIKIFVVGLVTET
jgi:hypothetical protein